MPAPGRGVGARSYNVLSAIFDRWFKKYVNTKNWKDDLAKLRNDIGMMNGSEQRGQLIDNGFTQQVNASGTKVMAKGMGHGTDAFIRTVEMKKDPDTGAWQYRVVDYDANDEDMTTPIHVCKEPYTDFKKAMSDISSEKSKNIITADEYDQRNGTNISGNHPENDENDDKVLEEAKNDPLELTDFTFEDAPEGELPEGDGQKMLPEPSPEYELPEGEEQDDGGESPEKEDKPNTCKGTCEDGTPCNNPVAEGEEYCHLHGGEKTSMYEEMMRMVAECMPKQRRAGKWNMDDSLSYRVHTYEDGSWFGMVVQEGDRRDRWGWSVSNNGVEVDGDCGILLDSEEKAIEMVETVINEMKTARLAECMPRQRCAYVKDNKRCKRAAKVNGYCTQHAKILGKVSSRSASKCYKVEYDYFVNDLDDMTPSEYRYTSVLVDADSEAEAKQLVEEWGEDRFARDYDIDFIGVSTQPVEEFESYEDYQEQFPFSSYEKIGASRRADNFATAPRIPDDVDIDSNNVEACPLCGDPNFDGSFCNVCGYEEPPAGFDDIDLETPESYDEYAEDLLEDEADSGKPEFDPDQLELERELEDKADELAGNAGKYEEPTDDEMAFA